MQIVLQAHGACSLIDVIDGLKHRMENVRSMWIELESERSSERPKVFTSVNMKYIVAVSYTHLTLPTNREV